MESQFVQYLEPDSFSQCFPAHSKKILCNCVSVEKSPYCFCILYAKVECKNRWNFSPDHVAKKGVFRVLTSSSCFWHIIFCSISFGRFGKIRSVFIGGVYSNSFAFKPNFSEFAQNSFRFLFGKKTVVDAPN